MGAPLAIVVLFVMICLGFLVAVQLLGWRAVIPRQHVSRFPPEHPIHRLNRGERTVERYLRSRFRRCDICGARVHLSADGAEMVHSTKETVNRCRGASGG